jgi:hypothetical protein
MTVVIIIIVIIIIVIIIFIDIHSVSLASRPLHSAALQIGCATHVACSTSIELDAASS